MEAQLDGASMVQLRGEHWCCLLCMRQFKSEQQVRKHLDKSSLHADNWSAALAAGRVSTEHVQQRNKRPIDTAAEAAPPPKRDRPLPHAPPAASTATPAAPSGALSALEQMELFEKRLKVQAKRQPDTLQDGVNYAEVDSNRARTMNGQMDWECSGCGMLNFAKYVTCQKCHKHIDGSTKYVTNRSARGRARRPACFLWRHACPTPRTADSRRSSTSASRATSPTTPQATSKRPRACRRHRRAPSSGQTARAAHPAPVGGRPSSNGEAPFFSAVAHARSKATAVRPCIVLWRVLRSKAVPRTK